MIGGRPREGRGGNWWLAREGGGGGGKPDGVTVAVDNVHFHFLFRFSMCSHLTTHLGKLLNAQW